MSRSRGLKGTHQGIGNWGLVMGSSGTGTTVRLGKRTEVYLVTRVRFRIGVGFGTRIRVRLGTGTTGTRVSWGLGPESGSGLGFGFDSWLVPGPIRGED